MYTSQWKRNPLHWASNEGHTTIVQLLLEAKADVNAKDVVSTALVCICVGVGTVSKNSVTLGVNNSSIANTS